MLTDVVQEEFGKQLNDDSANLLRAALISNLRRTIEERIEAHENALQLALDLREAGKVSRATES